MHGSLKGWFFDLALSRCWGVACAIVARTCWPWAGVGHVFFMLFIFIYGEGMLELNYICASEVAIKDFTTATVLKYDQLFFSMLLLIIIISLKYMISITHSYWWLCALCCCDKLAETVRCSLPVRCPKDVAQVFVFLLLWLKKIK